MYYICINKMLLKITNEMEILADDLQTELMRYFEDISNNNRGAMVRFITALRQKQIK